MHVTYAEPYVKGEVKQFVNTVLLHDTLSMTHVLCHRASIMLYTVLWVYCIMSLLYNEFTVLFHLCM